MRTQMLSYRLLLFLHLYAYSFVAYVCDRKQEDRKEDIQEMEWADLKPTTKPRPCDKDSLYMDRILLW